MLPQNDHRRARRSGALWLLALPVSIVLTALVSTRAVQLRCAAEEDAPAKKWRCEHKVRQGNYMMDFGDFAIIFQGVVKPPRRDEEWATVGTEIWSGNSEHWGSAPVAGKLPYHVVSSRDALEVTVGRHDFEIRDAGKALVFGTRTFEARRYRQMFIVRGQSLVSIIP